MELHDFSFVLNELKDWKKATRKWWNGKGMYLKKQNPDEQSDMNLEYLYLSISIKEEERIYMENWDEIKYKKVPWVASQTDLLSDDWIIL